MRRFSVPDMPLIPVSERVVLVGNRIDRDILFEANFPPGTNPMVATMAELQRRENGSPSRE